MATTVDKEQASLTYYRIFFFLWTVLKRFLGPKLSQRYLEFFDNFHLVVTFQPLLASGSAIRLPILTRFGSTIHGPLVFPIGTLELLFFFSFYLSFTYYLTCLADYHFCNDPLILIISALLT